MFAKSLIFSVLLSCVGAVAAESADTANPSSIREVVDSGKPFALIVGDNTVVVEKYRLVAVDDGKQAPAAASEVAETKAGNHGVAVNRFWDSIDRALDAGGDWFFRHREEFADFGIGLLLTIVGTFVLNRVVRRLIFKVFGRHSREKRGLVEALIRSLYWPLTFTFFAVGVRLSFESFQFVSRVGLFFMRTAVALALLTLIWAVFRFMDTVGKYRQLPLGADIGMDNLLASLWRRAAKLAIGIVGVLFIFQNVYGLNINTLLASAGVAGLAIAFAAQNTLANFFGSVMIIVDRPFTVGDRVVVGGNDGIVESVGFRSTRIRSLDGSIFVLPNSQIADAVVQNITRRPNIKYAFDIGLVYSTTGAEMEKAMRILHEILDHHPLFDMEALPPRVYFTELRDSALNISVIVWFCTDDWFAVQQAKSELNLAILNRFNAEKLSFAYPSQSIYLDQDTIHAIQQINPARQTASK